MAKSRRLSSGGTCAFGQDAGLNFSYAFRWAGDMSVSQTKGLNDRITAAASSPMPLTSIIWRY